MLALVLICNQITVCGSEEGKGSISNFPRKDFEVCQIHLSMEGKKKISLNYFYMRRELLPAQH